MTWWTFVADYYNISFANFIILKRFHCIFFAVKCFCSSLKYITFFSNS